MQHEYYCIEQLDLAGQQLHQVDPGYARFALILTDNIVELMLYRRCKREIIEDDGFFSYGQQYMGKKEYDAKARQDAIGQRFDRRLRFCRRIGVLAEPEHEFISSVHGYRNEVYHVGILHNDLLYPIAWQYHNFACDLFQRLSPLYRMSSSSDHASAVVRNHIGKDEIRLTNAEDDIATAAQSLKDIKPKISPGFAEQLSECALNRVYDFGNALYFLSDQGAEDESKILVEVQFREHLFGANSEFLEKLDEVRTPAEYQSVRQTARQGWKPKISKPPTERWLKRAENLKSEQCDLAAMKKFQSLLKEMDELNRIVKEAAEQYDHQIQLQLDTQRGK